MNLINYFYLITIMVQITIFQFVSAASEVPAVSAQSAKTEQETYSEMWLDAARHGNIKKMQKLLGLVDINVRDKFGFNALILATVKNQVETVEFLIQQPGINVNAKNNDGQCALWLGALTNREEIIRILLDIPGIVLNGPDKNGKTPYMTARDNKHKVVAELILYKIRTLIPSAFEAISVYAKASSDAARKLEIIKLKSVIGQIGVDGIIDEKGNTLLDKAFACKSVEMIEYLLQQAARPELLLAYFPFEHINPTSDLFKFFVGLAYGEHFHITKSNKLQTCHVCAQHATELCSGCKRVYYCSKACQKTDWKNHKLSCTN